MGAARKLAGHDLSRDRPFLLGFWVAMMHRFYCWAGGSSLSGLILGKNATTQVAGSRVYWRMEARSPQRLKILIAEDDPNDRKLLALAAAQSKGIGELFVLTDGQEAVEYLDGEGVYADRRAHPLPDVVVLDLKMPLMNGLEVLEWIRNQSPQPAMRW